MRLEHEADILIKIKRGSFAPLLDHGCEDDWLYIVMPFVPGITLQARMRQGPLSVHDSLTVGRDLLAGLGEAHAQGRSAPRGEAVQRGRR